MWRSLDRAGQTRSLLHNDTRSVDIVLQDGEGEDRLSSRPDHWYSLCVFFFHLSVYFSLSGDVRASVCSSPAVTVRVCTDGCQEGQIVYCFRPCGMPAVMDGLGQGFYFFSSDLCVSQSLHEQPVRSTEVTSHRTLISLDRKQESHHWGFFTTSVKIHLRTDVGHPSSALVVWGLST